MIETEINVISAKGFVRPTPCPDGGSPPRLHWIEIEALYVDRRYQRDLTERGRKNIARIAAEFDWSFFAPVIVAPMDGGDFFCIIDGQHRTTAALLIGKKSVPCAVVTADRAKQARAFVRVNGATTPVSPNAKLRAALAGGDAKASALVAALTEGGVRIPGSPIPHSAMKPGETNAVQTLESAFAQFDREIFVRALLALSKSPRGYIGLINRDLVLGLCIALSQMAEETREQIQARCDAVDLADIARMARRAHGEGGAKRQEMLVAAELVRRFLTPPDGEAA